MSVMNAPIVKIDRSTALGYPTKARHLFALILEVGQPGNTRYAGFGVDGEPTWIHQSAPRAHRSYRWYTPGDWYNHSRQEQVISVHLYREDGKSWHKDAQGEEVR